MDDAPDSDQNMPVPVENGDVLPQSEEETTTIISTDQDNNVFEKPKVNGEKEKEDSDKIDSSDCDPDTLIIDEKPIRKRKLLSFEPQSGFKGFKRIKSEEEIEPLTNPYFNESLFELSGLHRNVGDVSVPNNITKSVNYSDEGLDVAATTSTLSISNFKKGNSKKKSIGSPKLCEYAQYLGLQPTVQFKCPRCSQSGFQTLEDLNAHHPQCMTQDPVVPTTSTASTTSLSTNFRVTRKVFLCSACGTYYENWNLFLHMRNIHNRFVCLYCLGMFSHSEKLTLHLASKHNCVPRHLPTQEDFFREYKEPCYLMCCDCLTVFGETDDVYGHQCNGKSKHSNNENKNNKSTNSITNRPSTSQKSITSKINKQSKTKGEFVEHVTGDTQIVSSNNNESDNLNESVELNSLEVKNNITENSLPEEQIREPYLEEARTPIIENQNEFVDTNNQDSNSQMSMETDNEKATNVETELSNHKNLEDFSQNKENSENVVTETKESASEEDEMEEDSNKSFDDKSRSPSPCDNNFDEDLPTEQPNYEETLNDINDFLHSSDSQHEDTRKVPKVTLKLPKIIQPYVENGDSEDSDKLTMELDSMDYENDLNSETNKEKETENENEEDEQQQEQPEIPEYAVAGAEVPITELELEQPLDKFDIKVLLQKCLKQTIASCIYCNHARKIAVNGKQLALHAIAEHRFSAVVNSITAEELIPETFVMRIRESFAELETVFFSIESNADEESVTFSHIFECFQCRYATAVHKELYLHNRKMHAKTILLCIMCKSNFYSYSELICHLCPGIYESQEVNSDISFRCCMCVSNDLPSAFRLMVHLRKRHHICDVCLELCNNQSKLSNHVWKHKLHHICYRCGVAYRNKPDITKHLFWKHGTESVLCKKCLQKKWPHVYHFCTPPSTFTCEECNLNFSKAVALKVHKRTHDENRPHECTFEECTEKFISKRLLLKHEFKHREPPEDTNTKELPLNDSVDSKEELVVDSPTRIEELAVENAVAPEVEKKPKVDVYDLPALNLSESDTSDSEEEIQPKEESKVAPKEEEQTDTTVQPEIEEIANKCVDELEKMEINHDFPSGSEILENASTEPTDQILHVWDNFKNYQAKQIKIDAPNSETEVDATQTTTDQPSSSSADGETEVLEMKLVVEVINKDHDYCTVSETTPPEITPNPVERSQSIDHDYCFSNNKTAEPVQDEVQSPVKVEKPKSPAKPEKKESKDTSDSSDDSDSSSCECNSNCSCSSSSDSSSSSSDSSESDSSSSEGRRKQQARRERRRTAKQRGSPKKEQIQKVPETVKPVESHPQVQTELQIEESDLYTSESETDEEFYDQQPQKLANKLMMEKRKMLLAGVNTNLNGSILESSRPSTPSLPETEAVKLQKKKSKNKKKKKKNKKQAKASSHSNNYQFQYQQPIVSPLTLSLPKNSPCPTPTQSIGLIPHYDSINESIHSNDSSKRASKRRRIPNKFYGYSSDEEHEKYQPPVLKWPKADLPSPARQTPVSPQTVPPITIRTIPSFAPVEEPVVPRLVIPTPRENKTFQHFHRQPPIPMTRQPEQDSCTETNESSSDEEQVQPTPQPPFVTSTGPQPPLYCYCRCPYDEVSEMIGCDASDCAIEWFHFECVGIMVPPKGQWFCPDCRKKTQYAREYLASSPV